MARIFRSSARIADSDAFNFVILGVILANAAMLALETYESIERDWGATLEVLNDIFLGVFVVELVIRFLAVGANPARYFRAGGTCSTSSSWRLRSCRACARTRRCCGWPGCCGSCACSACCPTCACSSSPLGAACPRSARWR